MAEQDASFFYHDFEIPSEFLKDKVAYDGMIRLIDEHLARKNRRGSEGWEVLNVLKQVDSMRYSEERINMFAQVAPGAKKHMPIISGRVPVTDSTFKSSRISTAEYDKQKRTLQLQALSCPEFHALIDISDISYCKKCKAHTQEEDEDDF